MSETVPHARKQVIQQALADMKAGRLAQAEDLLAPLCAEPAPDVRVLRIAALVAHRRGRHKKAIGWFGQALALAPADTDTRYNLGVAYQARKQYEQAIACFSAVTQQQPRHVAAAMNLGVCFERAGRREQAAQAFEEAIRLKPDHLGAKAYLAALLSGSREPERLQRAEQAAREVLAARPGHAGAWDSLSLTLFKLDQADEAYEAGREAIHLAPQIVEYRLHLAESLFRAGRASDSTRILQQALAAHPDDPEVQRQAGVGHLRRGDAGAALACLDEALAKRPADQRALAHRGVALQVLGRAAEARALVATDRFLRQQRFTDVAPFTGLDAFNHAFAADIRAHPTLQFQPVGLAARGGSLTGELRDAPTEAIRVFERNLRRAIASLCADLSEDDAHPFLRRIPRDYRLNTWATLVPEQGDIAPHIHEQSWLSGAYYVALPDAMSKGDSERAGWIEFHRPSDDLPRVPEEYLHWMRPEEGLLLLFPSYWYHRTLPFRGGGERISVSFDLEPLD